MTKKQTKAVNIFIKTLDDDGIESEIVLTTPARSWLRGGCKVVGLSVSDPFDLPDGVCWEGVNHEEDERQ